mgnify:CR=1 FL=1
MITVRPSTEADLAAITTIYGWNVLNGLGTFEEDPPAVEEMARRRATFLERGLPYLVAELEGVILGYPPDKRAWLKAGDKMVTSISGIGDLHVSLV